MAWNHWRSGLRVPWEIVPAVMDDWCPHPLQCIKPRWVSHASPDKHRGQRKPDGQRTLMRYCRLLSSVANHRSNSPSVRGYSESTTSVRYPWESLEARGYVDSLYTQKKTGPGSFPAPWIFRLCPLLVVERGLRLLRLVLATEALEPVLAADAGLYLGHGAQPGGRNLLEIGRAHV